MDGSKAGLAGRDLQTLFEVGMAGALSDGQLLDRFVARREEAVFEAIIRRHGPMVWGVCRRVLRDHHDGEDAFQATFLVLARRAASIAHGQKLGNWLYGVAYQTARKARAMRAKRRVREAQVPDAPEPEAIREEQRDDRPSQLDRELSRLPEKYRIPVVLCGLEGMSHKEAASRLGWPVGTGSSRLSRARDLLTSRLSRRGGMPSVGPLAVLLAQDSAWASLPTKLVGPTARAASLLAGGGAAGIVRAEVLTLMEGVLKMLLLCRIRLATLPLAFVVSLGVGAVLLAQQGGGGRAARPEPPAPADPAIRPLIEARIETAREVYEQEMMRYEQTLTLFPMDIADWSRRWMEEELRLRTKPAERLLVIRDHWERAKRLEGIVEQYSKTGQGRKADALKFKYFRLEAEQMLAEARTASPDAPQPESK